MWKKQFETSRTIVQAQVTDEEKEIQVAKIIEGGGELLKETDSEEIYLDQDGDIIRYHHIYNGEPSDDVDQYLPK